MKIKNAFDLIFIIQLNLKGTSAVQQYHSRGRVFINLFLHQQLKFDNILYIVHAKWFVLIIDFPAGRHLEMRRVCQSLLLIKTIAINEWESGTATQLSHISNWRPAGNFSDQNKSLSVNYIYKELSNLSCWCRYKLRKTLIWAKYCWTAKVPFKDKLFYTFASLLNTYQVSISVQKQFFKNAMRNIKISLIIYYFTCFVL